MAVKAIIEISWHKKKQYDACLFYVSGITVEAQINKRSLCGSAILKLIPLLVLAPQKSSRTGLELFHSWAHLLLHPNPEVNPREDNWGKLRLLALVFLWSNRVFLSRPPLKRLCSYSQ